MSRTGYHQPAPGVPTSVLLDELLGSVTDEHVTLGQVVSWLGDRSFGVILLILALLGILPGVSALAGLLLAVPAVQMALAHRGPVFPRRLSSRQFNTHRVAGQIRRTVPILRSMERFIRPRWRTPLETTKRVVGIVVLLLGMSMLIPVPFSNIPPAILVALIAFAYVEEDGVLLCAALGAALFLLTTLAAVAWQTVSATLSLERLL